MSERADPQPGTWWQHQNGHVYHVVAVTNTTHAHPDHPPQVVYRGEFGRWWSRPLSTWHEKMTEHR